METFENTAENEKLKELAEKWRDRLTQKINQVLGEESPLRETITQVLWEEGVLGRVAPLSEEERKARQFLGKTVWQGDREDPELYWRILYSALYSKNAFEKGWTYSASNKSLILGALEVGVVFKLYDKFQTSEEFKNQFPDHIPEKQGRVKSLPAIFTDEIIKKAKEYLEERGIIVGDTLLPFEFEGVWNGILVDAKCADDGLIHLTPKNHADFSKLYELTKGRGVSPATIQKIESI